MKVRDKRYKRKGNTLIEILIAGMLMIPPLTALVHSSKTNAKRLNFLRHKRALLQAEDELKIKVTKQISTFLETISLQSGATGTKCVIGSTQFTFNGIVLENNLKLELLDFSNLTNLDTTDPDDSTDLDYSTARSRCRTANTFYPTSTTTFDYNIANQSSFYFCGLVSSANSNFATGTLAQDHPALIEFLYVTNDLISGGQLPCNTLSPLPKSAVGTLYYTIYTRIDAEPGNKIGRYYSSKFISSNPKGT